MSKIDHYNPGYLPPDSVQDHEMDYGTGPNQNSAIDVPYNNTDSTLIATLVKTALDELDAKAVIVANTWKRTGTDLEPVNAGDNVKIGTGFLSADSIKINDTDDSNLLSLIWNEDDSSDRILNILLAGGNRSLTIEADSLLNQDLTSDSSPTFSGVTLSTIIAADVNGLEIRDDGGNVAHYIADGGKNRFGSNGIPTEMVHVDGNILSDVSGVDQTLILNDTTDVSKLVLNAGVDATNRINQGHLVIGAGTILPSATFELVSTSRGFLPPRMTTAQRNAISSPATGLIIYNITTGNLEQYNGTFWEQPGQTGNRTATGAGDYNPSALTTDYLIAVDNTAAPRAVTISTEDVQSGSTSKPRFFRIKDESGGAAANNITVSLESGNIDGGASAILNTNYAAIDIYVDGTNGFIL